MLPQGENPEVVQFTTPLLREEQILSAEQMDPLLQSRNGYIQKQKKALILLITLFTSLSLKELAVKFTLKLPCRSSILAWSYSRRQLFSYSN